MTKFTDPEYANCPINYYLKIFDGTKYVAWESEVETLKSEYDLTKFTSEVEFFKQTGTFFAMFSEADVNAVKDSFLDLASNQVIMDF
jgi:hypothetical protein